MDLPQTPTPLPEINPPAPTGSSGPHRHFMNMKFLITLVILLVLGGGAYAGVNWYTNRQLTQENASVPSATVTPDTSTWKTYTNQDYGFEMKYLSGFSLHDGGGLILPDQSYNYFGRHSIDLAYISKDKLPPDVLRETISASVDGAGYPNGDYFFTAVDYSQGVPPPPIDTLQLNREVTINGIKWGLAAKDVVVNGTRRVVNVYHTYHNGWYEVQTTIWSKPGVDITEQVNELSQILSTFKFTTTAGTSTWKTYSYTGAYSFNFKYPADWIKDSNTIYSPKAPKGVSGVGDKITIETFANDGQLSIESWRTKNMGDIVIKDNGVVSTAGVVAHQYIEGGIVNYISTYISEGSVIIKIGTPENTQFLNIYNQVISTFRFLQ